jgi:hypothetical protein
LRVFSRCCRVASCTACCLVTERDGGAG